MAKSTSSSNTTTEPAVKNHKSGDRRGTGVHWNVDSRRSNIVYGAGVASPEERAKRRHATTSSATKAAPKATFVSQPRHAVAPALMLQPAKSAQLTAAEHKTAEREQVWADAYTQVAMIAASSSNITNLMVDRKDALWLVNNVASLPSVRFTDTWQVKATKLFQRSHAGRKPSVYALEAAMFSLNKALAHCAKRLVLSAPSVTY